MRFLHDSTSGLRELMLVDGASSADNDACGKAVLIRSAIQ
jgi:hypothetical protein